jgi:hypothetical protein
MRKRTIAAIVALVLCALEQSAPTSAAGFRMDQLPAALGPVDADILEVEQGGTEPMTAATLGQLRTYLSAIIAGLTPNPVSFTVPAAPGTVVATFAATCVVNSCSAATFALAAQAGCTGTDNGLFVLPPSGVLSIGNATVNAGPHTICVQISVPGALSLYVSVPTT